MRHIQLPMEDMGLASALFNHLQDQPKKTRKARFNKLKKMLLVFGLIDSRDQVASISAGVDSQGDYIVVIALQESSHDA